MAISQAFNFHCGRGRTSDKLAYLWKRNSHSGRGSQEPTCDSGLLDDTVWKPSPHSPCGARGTLHQILLTGHLCRCPCKQAPRLPFKHCCKFSSSGHYCSRLWATAKNPSSSRDFSVWTGFMMIPWQGSLNHCLSQYSKGVFQENLPQTSNASLKIYRFWWNRHSPMLPGCCPRASGCCHKASVDDLALNGLAVWRRSSCLTSLNKLSLSCRFYKMEMTRSYSWAMMKVGLKKDH